MRRISRFAAPVAVMALIFYLSAQPGLDSGLSFDFVLRKCAHMGIFGTLWFTILRATGYRRPVLAFVLAVAYAMSDEVHQSFVTDRHGSPKDVGFDTAGMLIAWVAWHKAKALRDSAPAARAGAADVSTPTRLR